MTVIELSERVAALTAERDQAVHEAREWRRDAELNRAALAAVEQDRDAMRPVVEAAQAWRRWFPHADSMFIPENALIAAVDAHRLSECVDETADDIEEDLRTPDIQLAAEDTAAIQPCQPIGCDNGYHLAGCRFADIDAAELPQPSSTRCPLCGDLPIGHEGECEP